MSEPNKAAMFQDNVFKLSDAIQAFCNEYAAENNINGMIVNVWALMSHLSESSDSKMNDLAGLIKQVPIAYHAQTLRVVVNRYAVENKSRTPQKGRKNKRVADKVSLKIRDILMAETENFKKIAHRIPSPFEVVYLTFSHMFTQIQKQAPKTEEMSLFMAMVNEPTIQNQVLSSYLDAFESEYHSELSKGVF